MVSAAAFAACFPTGKLAASVAPADLPIAPNGFKPVEPIYPVIEPQKFPAWVEDYKWLRSEHLPQMVSYATSEPAGTVIVDTDSRYLYLIRGFGQAKRYGIGVGRDGFNWSGTATIERKRKWPMWYPPKEMQRRDKEARRWRKGMPGGTRNPLGARALYLFQGRSDTLFRIHGTRDPKSIGKAVSSGCIRMLNADVIELFDRLPIGTKVVVLPSAHPVAAAPKRSKNILADAGRRRRKKRRTALYRRRYRPILDFFRFW